ncbi:MAG: hypothetical protein K6F55_01485, partial [Eubacterium sp.]|nr:hypothetical protein [Eubacterium sp.]
MDDNMNNINNMDNMNNNINNMGNQQPQYNQMPDYNQQMQNNQIPNYNQQGYQNQYQNNQQTPSFNVPNYTQTAYDVRKTGNSGLGIAALIFSILGCTAVIGFILAVIDLLDKKSGKKKNCSALALGVCFMWALIIIPNKIDKYVERRKLEKESSTIVERTFTASQTE